MYDKISSICLVLTEHNLAVSKLLSKSVLLLKKQLYLNFLQQYCSHLRSVLFDKNKRKYVFFVPEKETPTVTAIINCLQRTSAKKKKYGYNVPCKTSVILNWNAMLCDMITLRSTSKISLQDQCIFKQTSDENKKKHQLGSILNVLAHHYKWHVYHDQQGWF